MAGTAEVGIAAWVRTAVAEAGTAWLAAGIEAGVGVGTAAGFAAAAAAAGVGSGTAVPWMAGALGLAPAGRAVVAGVGSPPRPIPRG